jgi:hypothetical protein
MALCCWAASSAEKSTAAACLIDLSAAKRAGRRPNGWSLAPSTLSNLRAFADRVSANPAHASI